MVTGTVGSVFLAGLVGLAMVLVLTSLRLARNLNLRRRSFRNAGVDAFAALSTIFLIREIALVRRIPRVPPLRLTGLVAANGVLWAVLCLSQVPGEWRNVSSSAGSMLRRAVATIPANAEVVASAGVAGFFAGRRWVYPFAAQRTYPVKAQRVYFVVTPNQGIESVNVSDTLSALAYVASSFQATLVEQGHGVWVFRWTPPEGSRSFRLGSDRNTIPAWTAPGPAGTEVTSGPASNWFVASSGRDGYIVSGDYWRRGTGRYNADVELSANVPVNVEVWNQTSNTLLARRSLPSTSGLQDISFAVDLTRFKSNNATSGGRLAKSDPVSPRADNALEIRVWSGGNGGVSVYRLGLRRV